MNGEQRLRGLGVDDVVALAVILVLTAIALVGFHSSYGGTQFFVVGVVAGILGVAVTAGTHVLRLGAWLSSLVALVVYVTVGGVLAMPDRAIAGVFPSTDTIRLSIEQAVTGWKELITITPPVGDTGDLMVIPVACGFAAAFIGSMLALRLRTAWPAVLPPAVVAGLSILTGVNDPAAPLMQGAVFAGIAIAWLTWCEHRRRPLLGATSIDLSRALVAVVLLAVAFGAGHATADSLPFASDQRDIWRRTVTPPFDPREHPSPLAGYRAYIKLAADAENDDPVLFTVEGLPTDVPVRMATMDAYDGLVWQVSAGDPDNPSLRSSGSFVRVGSAIEPDFDGQTAEVTVTIDGYTDIWVPTVGEVESLRFSESRGGAERDRELNAAFRYNLGTDTAAAPIRLRAGDRYVMDVRLPALVDEFSGRGSEIITSVPQLPRAASVSEISESLVTSSLLGVNDWGTRLDLVRDEMVEGGVYSDGDTAFDQQPSRAGHSVARLADFVARYPDEQLIGNAEQFAATYALLFRELKVPTRVVMGFRPTASSEDGPVAVTAGDVDAWVEVPLQQIGWVDVAPTPSRNQIGLTDLNPQESEPEYRTQNPPPPPLLDPEFENPATARGDVEVTEDEEEEEEDEPIVELASSGGSLVGRLVAVSLIGTLVVAVLVVVAVVLIKRIRRGRRRRRGAPHVRIARGWNEVTDLAVDMGRPVPATTTRREAAELVGSSSVALAQRADAAVWGSGEPTEDEVEEFWSDLESYLADARKEAGFVGALRAGASAKSLRRRHQPDDTPPSGGNGPDEPRPGDAARPIRELREAGSAEAVVEFSGTYPETVEALHDVAAEEGYSIVASGPGTFRLERSRRPRWALVLTVLFLPVVGLGLVFLLVRRRDAAVVSVIDDRDRPRVRVVGSTDATLVASLRGRSDVVDGTNGFSGAAGPPRDGADSADHGGEADDREVVRAHNGIVLDSDDVEVPETGDDEPMTAIRSQESSQQPLDNATRVAGSAPASDDATAVAPASSGVNADDEDEDGSTRVEMASASTSASSDDQPPEAADDGTVARDASSRVAPLSAPAAGDARDRDNADRDTAAPDAADAADAAVDDRSGDEATIVRATTRARRSSAPRLVLPDGGTIDVGTGVVIGRDPDAPSPYHLFAHWTTADPSVSRTHLAVTVEGEALRVVDLGSSNGTTVIADGTTTACEPGQPVTAEIGSVIEVGDLVLRVESPSA